MSCGEKENAVQYMTKKLNKQIFLPAKQKDGFCPLTIIQKQSQTLLKQYSDG